VVVIEAAFGSGAFRRSGYRYTPTKASFVVQWREPDGKRPRETLRARVGAVTVAQARDLARKRLSDKQCRARRINAATLRDALLVRVANGAPSLAPAVPRYSVSNKNPLESTSRELTTSRVSSMGLSLAPSDRLYHDHQLSRKLASAVSTPDIGNVRIISHARRLDARFAHHQVQVGPREAGRASPDVCPYSWAANYPPHGE